MQIRANYADPELRDSPCYYVDESEEIVIKRSKLGKHYLYQQPSMPVDTHTNTHIHTHKHTYTHARAHTNTQIRIQKELFVVSAKRKTLL